MKKMSTHDCAGKHCVVPENIHTSPTEGIFFLTPPHPSGNPSKASCISSYFLIFQNPPSPRKFQSLLWGGEWIFSGTAH